MGVVPLYVIVRVAKGKCKYSEKFFVKAFSLRDSPHEAIERAKVFELPSNIAGTLGNRQHWEHLQSNRRNLKKNSK